MDRRNRLISFLTLLFITTAFTHQAKAQNEPYRFTPAPDIWYNAVDGIRLGVRVLGEMEGSFKDGPHRLDAGFWFGTKIPDLPVSYYLSFTEPISFISDFGEEGNINLRSSVRTGFSKHSISLNKRFQVGFDETRYKEFSVGFSTEKMFDEEYRQFPVVWLKPLFTLDGPFFYSKKWLHFFNASVNIHDEDPLGPFLLNGRFRKRVNGELQFYRIDLEAQQKIPLGSGFALSLRGFIGRASEETPYAYSYMSSMKSMVEWLDHGISRAVGTVPSGMFENGYVQFPDGANLRGYITNDIKDIQSKAGLVESWADDFLLSSITSLNVELDFPYPYERKLHEIPVVGDFFDIRNYLFFDIGRMPVHRLDFGPNIQDLDEKELKSDLGIGFQFSFNIPDYLGKDRGLFIRYDIPFWLSDPENDNPNFKYRSLLGIGAIISL